MLRDFSLLGTMVQSRIDTNLTCGMTRMGNAEPQACPR